jgi:uncharacterized membrane protein HdeD (DUF308 family)
MSSGFPYFLPPVHAGLHALRRNWGWLLLLGILDIVIGMMAISFPAIATLASLWVLGVLLLFGAGVQLAGAIWALSWGGFFLHLVAGLLSLLLGLIFIERRLQSAEAFTMVLAVFFVAGGAMRIAGALTHRFAAWGWTLLAGVVSLLLGIMIWRELPGSGLWVIGTLVGIDLLFRGWTWVMLAMAVRSIPAPPT